MKDENKMIVCGMVKLVKYLINDYLDVFKIVSIIKKEFWKGILD